jgi:Lsr2
MAQKLQTFLIDDLDGSDAEGTVRFGLDSTHYEIDLSTENAKELRTALVHYSKPPYGARLGHSVTSRIISRHAAHGN